MRIRTIVFPIAFAILLGGCASTSFKSTWKNPEAGPVEITGKKVVVVAVNVPTSIRHGVEDGVAQELNKLGAQALPSFQILPPEITTDQAKQKLAAEGIDAAWIIRVTDKEQEVYSTPGVYAPYGGPYWGGGWGMSAPEVHTNTNYFVETLVYSVSHDKLAWSGLSVTTNPSNIEGFSKELTKAAVAKMKSTGLLK